ncbi:hypothetical protein RRG08_042406 [Elysia crispata]|uniref:Uncharacterized protein n=1 Tax=Elysia crispata TaxID=231223 RepID=A0AAE0ZC17_9GAST|nr:hypothetical protein RRG08_042406 [Elysia crispata]
MIQHIRHSGVLQDVTTEELRFLSRLDDTNTTATVRDCRIAGLQDMTTEELRFLSRLDDTTHPPQCGAAGYDNRRVTGSCHVLMIQHIRHSAGLQDVTTEE